jgi:uncharacterized protein (TIGR02284 family)
MEYNNETSYNNYQSPNKEELVGALNDLVKINNDRIEGYQKAQEQAKENVDLQTIFRQKASDSQQYAQELKSKISALGGDPTENTTASGKIFRAWMDVKNTFKPADRSSILDSCAFGEKAAVDAYSSSLETDAEMPADIRNMIASQQSEIIQSHQTIQQYQQMNK